MRRVILLSLMLLISIPAAAAKDVQPLYADPLGWQVWLGIPGSTVVERYATARQQYGEIPHVPVEYVYLYEHAAPLWYLFSLVIPEDVVTLWGPTSSLTLTYLHGRDTCQAESNILFFVNAARTRILFLHELTSPLVVPNKACPVYSADQVPAVFVRFDFKGKQPDRLLGCAPTDVLTRRR